MGHGYKVKEWKGCLNSMDQKKTRGMGEVGRVRLDRKGFVVPTVKWTTKFGHRGLA